MDVFSFIDENGDRVYIENVGGWTTGENGSYTITIYDSAWVLDPAGNRGYDLRWLSRDSSNFKGVIAHELTHVVTNEHPEILRSIGGDAATFDGYEIVSIESGIYVDCKWNRCAVGRAGIYPSREKDWYWKGEMASMTVAAYMYSSPNPLGSAETMWVGNQASKLRPPQSPSGPVRRGSLYVY